MAKASKAEQEELRRLQEVGPNDLTPRASQHRLVDRGASSPRNCPIKIEEPLVPSGTRALRGHEPSTAAGVLNTSRLLLGLSGNARRCGKVLETYLALTGPAVCHQRSARLNCAEIHAGAVLSPIP